MGNNKKDIVLNIVKGLAILAVVIGHASGDGSFSDKFVNQFHLSAFFFVAGYFIKNSDIRTPFKFIIKKIKSLYIPFILICFMITSVETIAIKIYNHDTTSILDTLYMYMNWIVKGYWVSSLATPMWFVIALFIDLIYCIFILRFRILSIIISITLMLIAKFFIKENSSIFMMSLFYLPITLCGYYFTRIRKYYDDIYIRQPLRIISLLVLIIISVLNEQLGSLQLVHLLNEMPYTIIFSSLVGFLFLYELSKLISKYNISKAISYLGDISFSIMSFHLTGFLIFNIILYYYGELRKDQLYTWQTDNYFYILSYIILGVITPLCIHIGWNFFLLH